MQILRIKKAAACIGATAFITEAVLLLVFRSKQPGKTVRSLERSQIGSLA